MRVMVPHFVLPAISKFHSHVSKAVFAPNPREFEATYAPHSFAVLAEPFEVIKPFLFELLAVEWFRRGYFSVEHRRPKSHEVCRSLQGNCRREVARHAPFAIMHNYHRSKVQALEIFERQSWPEVDPP